MDKNIIDKEKLIQYWLESAEDDFETMMAMYNTGRYSWALFVGHLMVEKYLKAYFVKIKTDYPPLIHNLLRLAEKANIQMTDKEKENLLTITAFNINARYDDYKNSFKKKCTPDFTSMWIAKLKEIRKWIKKLILQ